MREQYHNTRFSLLTLIYAKYSVKNNSDKVQCFELSKARVSDTYIVGPFTSNSNWRDTFGEVIDV